MERTPWGTWNGQDIVLIHHPKKACEGEHCCLHNPSPHHMTTWRMNWRDDRGMMERICPHGIGHPDPDDLAYKRRNNLPDSEGIHGCDGCCQMP